MKLLVLNSNLLESLLDLDELRVTMGNAMRALSSGNAKNFPRSVADVTGGAIGFMAASAGRLLGYKAVAVFHRNTRSDLNPHQGLVTLLDSETGVPKAILDASTVTAMRTAAVSAYATELLAREDAKQLHLIGTGRQAFEHARSIVRVRSIEKISICGRSREKSEACAQRIREIFRGEIDLAGTPQGAILADIVVTATSSSTPLLSTLDLIPGCHLNAIGASRPGSAEIELVSRPGLKVFLDSSEACELESEELKLARTQGLLNDSEIVGELGEISPVLRQGRSSENDITVFKSVGLGIQDLVAADFFYRRAQILGVGQTIEF